MSRENVEALRRGFEAFNSGEIEGILAFIDADFEAVIPPELSAEPDTYRGHDGVRRYFQAFQDAMSEVRFDAERIWDVGESVVVVALRLTAKGKQTGIPVEQQAGQVWTLRDGKAVRVQTYPDLSDALDAAYGASPAPHASGGDPKARDEGDGHRG